MKLELLIIVISFFFIYNTWYDYKISNIFIKWKKHIKIISIIIIAYIFYYSIKKNKINKNLLLSTNEFIKYLPVDKSSGFTALSTVFDLTNNSDSFMYELNSQQKKMIQSQGGRSHPIIGNKTKRVVSETKKKYVASNQDWKCGKCNNKLNAWFEVDHKIRLEHGGTNEVNNLVALCRECHGKKTTLENL
uniref:HNH nuclease domain-containing protein n=1 Tax=viral metagenome TaxID=1070528 RepID=A0A6C0H5V9_9ZZZZ